jgi:hypothetical protein
MRGILPGEVCGGVRQKLLWCSEKGGVSGNFYAGDPGQFGRIPGMKPIKISGIVEVYYIAVLLYFN